ncbi:Golgi apparatus protein 1b isoform X1, partial [Tachysurus ichikawai]
DIQIEALLIRACEPVIQTHCHDVADNQLDTGDLMECLVQNKHQKEMNDKCAVGVTHFQLVSRTRGVKASIIGRLFQRRSG